MLIQLNEYLDIQCMACIVAIPDWSNVLQKKNYIYNFTQFFFHISGICNLNVKKMHDVFYYYTQNTF